MKLKNMKYSLILALALAGFSCAPMQGMSSLNRLSKSQQELNTDLYVAVESGNVEEVEACIQVGGSVNSIYNKYTPLHCAVEKGDLVMVKRLAAHGADMTKKSLKFGKWTPLELAAINGTLEILKYFINYGVDISSTNNQTCQPLFHTAVLCGPLDAVKWLVENGADTKIKKNRYDSRTALMCLCEHYNNVCESQSLSYNDRLNACVSNLKRIRCLQLATYYAIARGNNELQPFLKSKNFSERQDILEIALAHNNGSDLEIFNKLDPKRYSWEYMLALAEQKDLDKPVVFLMVKIGAHPNKSSIKEICDDAKTNGKENFIKALRDYQKTVVALYLADNTSELPKELVCSIMEFRG